MTFNIVLSVVLACAAAATLMPFGADLKRAADHPVLMPREGKFDDAGAYNPAAVKIGRKYVLIYRAQNKAGTSFLGYAESGDGVHFTAADKPLMQPDMDYEKDGGMEDPRVVRIGKTYYLTYTGYNKKDAQLCLATSADLRRWKRKGIILPAYKGSWNKGWTKSGAIVRDKINGKYWMYYLGTADGADQMGVAESDDLIHWKDATNAPVLSKRLGQFDSKVIEPGPPPIMTDDGILLIYNGADDKLVYRVGWALFDKNDPTKLIARSDKPIFEPKEEWEINGQVPNVVFVEGLIEEPNRLLLYYGGADRVTGVAETTLTRVRSKH
jgi:predicted GH43/DUF377 family glycosyl hydrolase